MDAAAFLRQDYFHPEWKVKVEKQGLLFLCFFRYNKTIEIFDLG